MGLCLLSAALGVRGSLSENRKPVESEPKTGIPTQKAKASRDFILPPLLGTKLKNNEEKSHELAVRHNAVEAEWGAQRATRNIKLRLGNRRPRPEVVVSSLLKKAAEGASVTSRRLYEQNSHLQPVSKAENKASVPPIQPAPAAITTDLLPAPNTHRSYEQTRKGEIQLSDLTWEEKERVLQVLFSKLGGFRDHDGNRRNGHERQTNRNTQSRSPPPLRDMLDEMLEGEDEEEQRFQEVYRNGDHTRNAPDTLFITGGAGL